MKKLMVLAAGILQVPVIKKGREMGYYVIAVDGNPDACGFKYADHFICADITDEKNILEIAIKEEINGVIHPCSEVSMAVMGRINEVMGLTGITYDQAIKATNKHLMRQAFEAYGAPSPLSILTESAEHAWAIFNTDFSSDVIIKPSRNSGSRGIAKIHKGIFKDEFVDLYSIALNESRDKSVLIEQFVDGPEFSVEIIVWDNIVNVLAVTDKKTTGAPHFVELGHNQPSIFPEDIVALVSDAAVAGVKALGVNACACHAEVKVQDGKAYLMEVGARMGGDFISTVLTQKSTGIDMTTAAINCALGVEPNLRPQKNTSAVCVRFFCPNKGQLVRISNIGVLDDNRVIEYELYVKEGDVIQDLTNSTNRSGHVIVEGKTPIEAVEFADYLLESVNFEIYDSI